MWITPSDGHPLHSMQFPARPKIINNNKAKEQYELLQEGRITTVTLRSLLEDPRFRNTQKNGNLAKLGSLAREYGVDEKSLVKLVSYCYLPTVQAVSDGRLVALPVANDE